MMAIKACLFSAALALAAASTPAGAEGQISVYGGYSVSHDSDVTITGPVPFAGSVPWDGESFAMPPYYGVRATAWFSFMHAGEWGAALDFTHNKVAADTLPPGYTHFEFTDGINYVTLNALKRWPLNHRLKVYAGAGAGVSVPHVEVTPAVGPKTYEYQATGPVVQALAGIDVSLNDWFSIFAEYKLSHSWNEADLKHGGTLDFDLLSHQFILGASLWFGGPPPAP